MLRTILASLFLVSLTAGCASAAAMDDDASEASGGALSSGSSSATCSAKSHAASGDDKGYFGIQANCAHVTVDGKACTINLKDVFVSVGLGGPLGSPGWTVDAPVSCAGVKALSISGVDNESYPQTGTTAFGDEPAASLDFGTSVFSASSATIATGPTGGGMGLKRVGVVSGKARVTSKGAAHDVVFSFGF